MIELLELLEDSEAIKAAMKFHLLSREDREAISQMLDFLVGEAITASLNQ